MFTRAGKVFARLVYELGAANVFVQGLVLVVVFVIVLTVLEWLFDFNLMHPLSTNPNP